MQSITTLELAHDWFSGLEESAILTRTYLTIPIGSLLDVNGVAEFIVGQWACLPVLPQGLFLTIYGFYLPFDYHFVLECKQPNEEIMHLVDFPKKEMSESLI